MSFREFLVEGNPTFTECNEQLSESSKVRKGTKVFEHGHLVGKITKVVDNPTYGYIYHVIDADGDEWTFHTGNIKEISNTRIDVIT